MNNFVKNTLIVLTSVAATFTLAYGVAFKVANEAPANQKVGAAELNRFITPPTNSTVACGTSSTLALASSTSRQYVALVNDSSTPVYLALGRPAVGSNGIRLNSSGGAYEMDNSALFTGPIYCIASSTAVLTVIEAK